MNNQTTSGLTIESFAVSNLGKVRKNNEDKFLIDACAVTDEQLDIASTQDVLLNGGRHLLDEGVHLFAVCDGMGGEEFGEVASRIAMEELAALYADPEALADNAVPALERANQRIFAQVDEMDLRRIGTTVALAYVKGGNLNVVNVGDSRVYLQRGETLRRVSRDHTEVQYFVDAKLITPEEAMHHPMRHRITQHLGMDPEKTRLSLFLAEPEQLCDGDRVMLCSDGLSDMLDDQAILKRLRVESSAEDIAKALVHAALEAGGHDNVTVVVLTVQS